MSARSRTPVTSHDDIERFQHRALKSVLDLLASSGVDTVEKLNAVKGKQLLEVPLWKLLEVRGKYAQQYVSAGVRKLEDTCGEQVSKSRGRWPEQKLRAVLGMPPAKFNTWSSSNDH